MVFMMKYTSIFELATVRDDAAPSASQFVYQARNVMFYNTVTFLDSLVT